MDYPTFNLNNYLKISKYTDSLFSNLERRAYLFFIKVLLLKRINAEKNHDKSSPDFKLLYKIQKDLESVDQKIQVNFSHAVNDPEPERAKQEQKTVKKPSGKNRKNDALRARELFNKLIDVPEYELKPDEKELLIKAKSTITECISKKFKPCYKRALERINPSENTYFNVRDFIKIFGFRNEINPVILEKLTGSFFLYAKEKGYKITSENKNNLKIETIKTIK